MSAFASSDKDEHIERTLVQINECFVFRIPPRVSAAGHRAADWKDQIWEGRLRIVEKGPECAIMLSGRDGELFAVCRVNNEGPPSVEPVADSSRYFVLRVENDQGGHAYIGLAFQQRNDAFDFNVALADHKKSLTAEADDMAAAAAAAAVPHVDYSLAEGQKIHVNIGAGGGGRRRPPAPAASGGMLLPPPPAGAGRLAPPPSSGSAPRQQQPQQQPQQQQRTLQQQPAAMVGAGLQQQQPQQQQRPLQQPAVMGGAGLQQPQQGGSDLLDLLGGGFPSPQQPQQHLGGMGNMMGGGMAGGNQRQPVQQQQQRLPAHQQPDLLGDLFGAPSAQPQQQQQQQQGGANDWLSGFQ